MISFVSEVLQLLVRTIKLFGVLCNSPVEVCTISRNSPDKSLRSVFSHLVYEYAISGFTVVYIHLDASHDPIK